MSLGVAKIPAKLLSTTRVKPSLTLKLRSPSRIGGFVVANIDKVEITEEVVIALAAEIVGVLETLFGVDVEADGRSG